MKQNKSIRLLIFTFLIGALFFFPLKKAFGNGITLYGCITPQFSLFAAVGGGGAGSEIKVSNMSGGDSNSITANDINSFTNDVFSFVVKMPFTTSTFPDSSPYQVTYQGPEGSDTVTFQKNGDALEGIPSVTSSGKRLCDIPLPPEVHADTLENSISLAMTDRSTNETSFELERAADCATFRSIHAFSVLTSSPYNDAGETGAPLQPGVLYCYRVYAFNTNGKSFSNVVAAKINAPGLPPVPSISSPVVSPVISPSSPASSQDFWGTCLDKSVDPNGVVTLSCLPYLFKNVITGAFILAGTIAVFLIIWSGIRFLLSQGDPKKVQDAKITMIYAIVGLILVLSAGFILNVFSSVLNIPCIKLVGFDTCNS